MTSEEFKRIAILKTMQKHLFELRPKLVALEVTDFWHLTHAERLVLELLAEPGCEDFHDRALSLYWHIQFTYADYTRFRELHGLPPDDGFDGQLSEGGAA